MTPQPNVSYIYQDGYSNIYYVLFTTSPDGSNFFPQFFGSSSQPQYDVPYTYMDSSQLYVVVFGNNVQIETNPTPDSDGTPGDSVFNIQMVPDPNPSGFDAYQFSIFGLIPNQIYVSLAVSGNRGKIVTKPILDPPSGAPMKLNTWPDLRDIIEAEFSKAMQSAFQRIEKLLEK